MIELDDIDRRIVAVLQAESRLPIVDLADRVGLSPTPCQRRVKRLEEEGVITRYAALVSPPAMGLGLQALVQVTLDDHSEKVVEAFEADGLVHRDFRNGVSALEDVGIGDDCEDALRRAFDEAAGGFEYRRASSFGTD